MDLLLDHENINVGNTGQSEVLQRNYKRLKIGGGQAYDLSRLWIYPWAVYEQ
jgi:hypothetical protein